MKTAQAVMCCYVFFSSCVSANNKPRPLKPVFFFFSPFYRDYVREELQYGYEGAVYLDSLAFNRFVSAMTSESQN